jgi:Ca-activated chloride channel family protein
MKNLLLAMAATVAPLAIALGNVSQEVTCRVEMDRAVLPADSAQRAVVKVTLDAPPAPRREKRPPVNLAIVLDRSGSMGGEKMEKAKEAAIEALHRLGPQDLVSVVVYDDEVESIVPAQSASNTEWIEGRIRGIHPRGSTALFAGVSQGAAEVRKNLGRGYVSRVILLSDGLANVGPSSPSDLGRLGAAFVKEGISVTTVGVGLDFSEDLMTELARNSDGNTYFVESSADLPRIFAAELGDVLSVVARSVLLEINFPDGVRPIRIIGRDGRMKNDGVEIYLNQLYGGQEKYALVEIEVPPTAASRKLQVASARCQYDNALTKARGDVASDVVVEFSPREEEVRASVQPAVVKEVVRQEAAAAREQAVILSDEGNAPAAAASLRSNAQRLGEVGARYGYDDLQAEGKELDAAADKLEKGSYDNRDRKKLKTDSYQIENQQKSSY